MNQPFGNGALRLCGLVMGLLGWRPEDFWSATPAEIAALAAPDPNGGSCALDREELNALLEHAHD